MYVRVLMPALNHQYGLSQLADQVNIHNSRPCVTRSDRLAAGFSRPWLRKSESGQPPVEIPMYKVRLWSVRNARFLETVYNCLERTLVLLAPVLDRLGYDRLEKPFAVTEQLTKGLLFDCRMCGQCMLSSSGMSCPMNCPKTLRNGPCGGVRPGGYCEVKPEMRCVWVEAFEGSRRMRNPDAILQVQEPVDARLKGTSSWLRVVRQKTGVEET